MTRLATLWCSYNQIFDSVLKISQVCLALMINIFMLYQVDRHLRKLDQELAKFKMELEADNAGITEILERREFRSGLCFWNSFFISVLTRP